MGQGRHSGEKEHRVAGFVGALVTLTLACGGLATIALVTARPASATTIGTVQTIAGTVTLDGVACPSTSICQAVGENGAGQGILVAIAGGVPGTARVVPGTQALLAVACTGPTTCVAVGENGASQGVLVPIAGGVAGTARIIAGTQVLGGLSCPSTTTCMAVGSNTVNTSLTQGVVVPITNGTAGAAQMIRATSSLAAVACANATTCEAVGVDFSFQHGVVLAISNGTAGTAQVVPGSALLQGVACPTTTACEAVGHQQSPSGSSGQVGMVVPIVNGTAGAPQVVEGSTSLNAVTCTSAVACEAVGAAADVPINNGMPEAVQPVQPQPIEVSPNSTYVGLATLKAVACPSATSCQAVGNNTVSTATFQTEGSAVAITPGRDPATLTYPTDIQTVVDTTHPFTWSADPLAQAYLLTVGTTPFGKNLVNSGVLPPTQFSYPMPALSPASLLSATLYEKVGGTWTYQMSTFNFSPMEAMFTSIADGETGVDPTAPFTWSTPPQAQGYIIVVGTKYNGTNVVNSGLLPPTQSSFAAPILPTGTMLYADLFTEINGTFTDYQAVAFTTGPALGALSYPVSGQTVVSPGPFTWTTIAAAQDYYLVVGTTRFGKDLVDSGVLAPTRSSFSVPSLPPGRTLYATLLTKLNGTWVFQAVTFVAATEPPGSVQRSPAQRSPAQRSPAQALNLPR